MRYIRKSFLPVILILSGMLALSACSGLSSPAAGAAGTSGGDKGMTNPSQSSGSGTSGTSEQGQSGASITAGASGTSVPVQSGTSGTPESSATAQADNTSETAVSSAIPVTSAIPISLETMTLEEKVGQMLFPAFRTTPAGAPLLVADEATLNVIRTWKPGGVVLFASNLDTVPQTAALTSQLQEASRIPLFLGIDEEGGKVSRLSAAPGLGAVSMPPAEVIGKTGEPDFAREAAAATAAQLMTLGINLDFAPVADINTNPKNPVIGNRAYGTKPKETAAMVTAALGGYLEGGIIPVIKHFPGHGDTETDSHLGLAVVPHDRKRLDSVELVPFLAAMKAGAPVIMTAHVNTPGISDKNLPATLNPDILTGLLRKELGFKGVIVTDAMEMGAITKLYGADESIVMAVEAGADMLLVPVSLEGACKAILNAVRTGRIPEKRLDESVSRILALKAKFGLIEKKTGSGEPGPQNLVGTDAYRDLVRRINEVAGK